MYGNINTLIAFEKELVATETTITGSTTSNISVSVPGAIQTTDIVGFVNIQGQIANVDGEYSVNAYVSANGVVTVSVSAATTTIIAAGTKIRGLIARCDNGFKSDGL